jgi:GT2 family glycosyltransferase
MRTIGNGFSQNCKANDFAVNHDWFLQNPGSTPFSPSAVLLTQGLAARVGGWNTSLTGPAEDFDYFRRCAKFGVLVSLNEVLVSHRQHSGSLTAINALRYFEDNRRVLKIMFAEDRSKLNLFRRVLLWNRFHLNFIKHFVKVKKLSLMFLVFRSLFQP